MEEKINEIKKEIKELSEQLSEGIQLFTSQIAMTKQCEMMLYKEYRGTPMVIKDGILLNDNDTQSIDIHWDKEEGFKVKVVHGD